MKPTKVQVVIFRRNPADQEPQILLFEKAANGTHTYHLLTGFIENEESAPETVLRECMEESGLESLGKPLDLKQEITFHSQLTNKLECEHAYAVESLDPTEVVDLSGNPDHEHVGFRWVEPEEAYHLLFWDSFKETLQCFLRATQE